MIDQMKIKNAAKELEIDLADVRPEGVVAAYEWIDAQEKTKVSNFPIITVKGYAEPWGGVYFSRIDLTIAIHLHPDVRQRGRYCNLSKRLTMPSLRRLEKIPGLSKRKSSAGFDRNVYSYFE